MITSTPSLTSTWSRDLRCGECRYKSWLRDGSDKAAYLGLFFFEGTYAEIWEQVRRSGRQQREAYEDIERWRRRGIEPSKEAEADHLSRSHGKPVTYNLNEPFGITCRAGHWVGADVSWVVEQVEAQTVPAPIFLPKTDLGESS